MDPMQIVPGAPPLLWSPINGAQDSRVAEKRARAFASGARSAKGSSSDGAVFFRQRAGTLLMCLLHAAALDGASLQDFLKWARRPSDPAARRILDHHPAAAPGWADKLDELLTGDDRTVGNTLASVAAALAPFDHSDVVDLVDAPAERCTDLRQILEARGTVYALGKDDVYGSIAPLVTAIVEDVFDTAEAIADSSPTKRCDPAFLACLDEAPNLSPIPTLRQRVADGRGRGICCMYAAQGWSSVVARWGEDDAAELASFTSNVVVFGGCKDPEFLEDMSKLCGEMKVTKKTQSHSRGVNGTASTSTHEAWEPVLRPHEIGRLDVARGHTLVLAENLPPVISRMTALFERKKLWRDVIEPEIALVREETERARAQHRAARLAAASDAGFAWQATTGPGRDDDTSELPVVRERAR